MKVAVALHKRKNCVSENRVSGNCVTGKPLSWNLISRNPISGNPVSAKKNISENPGSGTPLGETPFWGNTVSGNCVTRNCVSENYVSRNRVSGIIPGDPFTGMNSSFNPGSRFAGSCFGDLNNFHFTAFMRLTCKRIVRKIIFGLEKWVKKNWTDL